MYLRPPSANEEARISDWIKVRQSGIRYYLSLGDQRIVDKHFIIRPKAEFEVWSCSSHFLSSCLLSVLVLFIFMISFICGFQTNIKQHEWGVTHAYRIT